MTSIDLCGRWWLGGKNIRGMAHVAATVPGCVHTDLLAAGKIPDPFYRDNEKRLEWIGETDWTYTRTFTVPAALLAEERIELVCEGLDTLATLVLNGRRVNRTDNMFRTWRFDVKRLLKPGRNTLVVVFAAVMPVARRAQQGRFLWAGNPHHRGEGNNRIRKEPCNFGWDWGPKCVTAGIWRPIRIEARSTPRLTDVCVTQAHSRDRVDLTLACRVAGGGGRLRARIGRDGCVAAEGTGAGDTPHLCVRKPALWWPNGMGDQPLYDLTVELLDDAGRVVDTWQRRVGLRRLELVREKDRWGESFTFRCNGVDFFAKGANWIPADVFQTRVTRERYTQLLASAVRANMNMLRVWGGGVYEEDAFYDLCDELGICVWQEFMFACASYPSFEPAFMASVEAEARDNVRRIRHHASLAIWCGNNELEHCRVPDDKGGDRMTWAEYSSLFDVLLARVVAEEAPGLPYWPSSGHTPVGDRNNPNDPASGDAHLWSVWHGRQPFEWYRTAYHRFCSEFGFQSFPEPRTIATFAEPEDHDITSYVMEHHQRCPQGNAAIMDYLLRWYRMPTSFESLVWLSQIQQAMSIKYAVEHWRRNRPRCMGALYWQINDCWPVASWSSIDSLGRWKALQYFARRFFAPLLISGVEDATKGTVEVHIGNDRQDPFSGRWRWRATRADGTLLRRGVADVTVGANRTRRVAVLELADVVARETDRDIMVWLELLDSDEQSVSDNFVSFCKPKHFALGDPRLRTTSRSVAGGRAFEVTLTAAQPALWAWLELDGCDAAYEDNFVCVTPERPVTVRVTPATRLTAAQFRRALQVRSIRDTYKAADHSLHQ